MGYNYRSLDLIKAFVAHLWFISANLTCNWYLVKSDARVRYCTIAYIWKVNNTDFVLLNLKRFSQLFLNNFSSVFSYLQIFLISEEYLFLWKVFRDSCNFPWSVQKKVFHVNSVFQCFFIAIDRINDATLRSQITNNK